MKHGGQMRSRLKFGLTAALLALALVGAACSSDENGGANNNGSGNSEPSGSESDQVAAAAERMESYLSDPHDLVKTEKLSAAPEKGKHIVWLQCSQPSCGVIGDGVEEAAGVMGWTMERIDFSNTDPESIITAMEQAVRQKPDGIALSGVPSERFEVALEAAHAAGIPVVNSAVIDNVGGMDGNGIIALLGGPGAYKHAASVTADWVIADSDGKANVLVVTADDFPIIRQEGIDVRAHFDENCDDCSVHPLNQAVADIAVNTPSNVVSALQENPAIDYVYFGFGDLSRGVAVAIADAGLDAQVVGIAPTPENSQRIVDGEEAAWTSWSTPIIGWDIMDAFARHFNSDDMAPVNNQPLALRLMTIEHPPSSTEPIYPENYEELYRKLWLLDG